MIKPRKQTYTMDMYLNKIKDKDIRSDADVQRLAGQWKSGQINELIYTVLTEDYIPPIILGEEKSSQLWIIDGLQRSSTLMRFRYGNYKITSSIEDSIITYRAKKKDKKGNIEVDENGDIIWENVEFNLKNKTYDKLPEELKKRFNEYQIETVIHEECEMKRISKLIKRYNNHTGMNAEQRAFTNVENFAREIRRILDLDFFSTQGGIYSEADRTRGKLERMILESVMCMFHFDNWKTGATDIAKYLNKNSCEEEFEKLKDNVLRISNVVDASMKDIFTSKDSFIWFTFYNRFADLGLDDNKFIDFLHAFKAGLRNKEIDGKLFDTADKNASNKDKSVIITKLHILETLMYDFFHINSEDLEVVNTLDFIKENVKADATEEDVELYSDMLDDLTIEVDNNTKLLNERNRPSLIALVGYACENDIDLDEWIKQWFATNTIYILNQKDNFNAMISNLKKGTAA